MKDKHPDFPEPLDIMEIIQNRKNWPGLIGAFFSATAALAVVFVVIVMTIGH